MSWEQRIGAAEKVGHFGAKDISLACRWGTCAVGFDPRGIDERLEKLGERFVALLSSDDFKGARRVLRQIEKQKAETGVKGE